MWKKLVLVLFGAALMQGATCNPSPGTGTEVKWGVGIRDYYTMRSVDGSLTTRDVKPEPRPREAITGDDYFQLKLEHIYIGEALGRDVGNVAIISQVSGVLPPTIKCNELSVDDLGFDLNTRERANQARSASCAFKHVVAVNPVFAQGHVTFDSAFISPPFRMGQRPVGLRFMIAQLNDVELARQLLQWGEEQLNSLSEWGLAELDLTQWQSKLIDIGFTVANYILDYAATPDYVFEFQTDFVPIETVGGVDTPQNLFMGGDFVIVGFPNNDDEEAQKDRPTGALLMSEKLVFDSGRLYWKGSKKEFRDGPYIIFKVVRESRYPSQLPVALAKINRELERGADAAQMSDIARTTILDLQDAHMLNETEGRYLLDLIGWFTETRALEASLEGQAFENKRPEASEWPAAMQNVPPVIGSELVLLDQLALAKGALERLDQRIYANYARNPGMWQAECVAIRDLTQGLSDSYRKLRPAAERAYEDLTLERARLEKEGTKLSADQQAKLEEMRNAEIWAKRLSDDLPEELVEPKCPALRR